MNLFKIFKRTPLWEKDFKSFAKKAKEKDLDKYISTLPEGRELDFTYSCWGHSYSPSEQIGKHCFYGHGFMGSVMTMLGSSIIQAGDNALLQIQDGRVGIYKILHVRYEHDPRDMFWAYCVCIGIKEQQNKP